MSRTTHDYFSGLAGVYDASRPSYPIEAIDWTLDGLPRDGLPRDGLIVDIGCGTGISTRLLKACGGAMRVIGIDPNDDMLRQARRATCDAEIEIEYRWGTGERTGLEGGVATLVVVAQAFHWLRHEDALREFHRVLLPRGRLALLWNVRDDGHDAFTTAYSELARQCQANARAQGFETHDLRSADATVGGWFENSAIRAFPNPHRLTLEGLLDRARSASYFPRPGNPLRPIMEARLHDLFDQCAHDGAVTLWHRTEVTMARATTS